MRSFWLLAVSLVFVVPFTFAVAQGEKDKQGDKDKDKVEKDKKVEKPEEKKILNKTVGEWIKILQTHELENYRRAALPALEGANEAHRTGAGALIDCVEKDKSPKVRLQAVGLIGRLGPNDFKPGPKLLIAVLKNDKADEVREAAATQLGNDRFLGQAQLYVPDLAEALKDPHAGTRIAVATTLRSLGEHARPALPALFEAAKNPKEELLVRTSAVHVIGRHAKDDSKTVPLLIDLAGNDKNAAALREIAIDGLGRSGSKSDEVIATLAKVVTDSNVELRKASAAALGSLGSNAKSAWPTLKERLAYKDVKEAKGTVPVPVESNSAVRNHLLRLAGALGKGNPEAVEALTTAAVKDESTENRIAAIQELGELGPLAKGSIATLESIASQDARAAIREAAGKAVKQIKQ